MTPSHGHGVKTFIAEGLCRELNLMMIQAPLIVDVKSGVNEMLDRDGSPTPVEFDCGLGWGICADMKAVRKRYLPDHGHSSQVTGGTGSE